MKIGTHAKSSFKPLDPGTYPAVCTGVVGIGEQFSPKFKKYSTQCMIILQLPNETIEIEGEQKPRQLSKIYTISASRKSALRTCLSTWNGIQYDDAAFREVDLFDQVGKACMVTTALNETGEYANIASIVPMLKGVKIPKFDFTPVKFDVDEWDDVAFNALPEWIQRKIKQSTQYQKAHPPTDTVDFAEVSDSDDEDVPF